LKLLEGNTLSLSGQAVEDLLQAVLDKGALFRFRARGGSMTPFIRDGDAITIAPLDGRPPRLGEVVAFSHLDAKQSDLVIHRVVERRGGDFVIQGDGNGLTQEIVPLEVILGRVVKVEHDGRCVRLGFGPERLMVAWLSRTRLLWNFVWPVWNRVRQVLRRANGHS
jgi:signal peptidase I